MQVAPAELEGCLLGHPEVVDACVIGIPDNYYGELPLAYVVLSADAVKRISSDPTISAQLRASIAEVSVVHVAFFSLNFMQNFHSTCSMSPIGKHISSS
jgi:acyl-coenzyme A synthetase/AMP-(fatty) acid ligase